MKINKNTEERAIASAKSMYGKDKPKNLELSSSYVALPNVWLSERLKPRQTLGLPCSKCTNCVFISFVPVAWYSVYHNSEIPSLQECVASLKGWKAAQQNAKESVHSVVFVKPVVNELTHSRRNSIYFKRVPIRMNPGYWILLNLYNHERKIKLCSNAMLVAVVNDLV